MLLARKVRARKAKHADHQAQRNASQCLASKHLHPIARPHFTQRECANHQGRGLRACVAARRDDQRDEHRELNHALELPLERVHHIRREEAAEEEHDQPGHAALPVHKEVRLEVALLHRRDGAHHLRVFGRLIDHHVDDVIDRDQAQHPPMRVHHRQGVKVVFGNRARGLFAVIGVENAHDILGHHIAQLLAWVGQDQVAQRDDTHELVAVGHAVDVIDDLGIA